MTKFRKILLASVAFAAFGVVGLGYTGAPSVEHRGGLPTCRSCGVQ
ncbi:MAG TPA: hypothetical protein VED40_20310 [Azospirillaceae bacterium]|nr:hypothetical protein [Azospirillaceae bacterium]